MMLISASVAGNPFGNGEKRVVEPITMALCWDTGSSGGSYVMETDLPLHLAIALHMCF